MRFVTKDILPKHTWIMRLHGVLISKYIVLLLFSIVWNHWGDLRSHGVLHIWDDSLFCIFSFSSCACNGRRSWGDFSWQLGGVVPWRMTVDCNVGLRWRWEFHMDLIHWLPISSYIFLRVFLFQRVPCSTSCDLSVSRAAWSIRDPESPGLLAQGIRVAAPR